MTDDQHKFDIYLPGLLKVLAESLYSNEKVAVRELLQNAHDSCVRRAIENTNAPKPRIDVSLDAKNHILTIRDNGSGLTESEIKEYLSTIGRSYTRNLKENLSVFSPDKETQLIGQFGLGFLSAFLIASQITVTTRSFKEGNPTLQWQSNGDIHYSLATVDDQAVGTTVSLELKPSASYLTNLHAFTGVVQQYADFLPTAIHISGERLPLNTITPPWNAIDPQMAISDYIQRKFNNTVPLCVIPLKDHVIQLGHDDSIHIPLSGFLFVPAGTVVSLVEYGDIAVYIRRMFICDDSKDLLPPWARFVRGVIDSSQLQPTASREQLQRDENFALVQRAIRDQLLAGLRKITQEEPLTWRKIVEGHRNVILGWAVKEKEFFTAVADVMPFRTSRGNIALPEYLKQSDNTLYYMTRQAGSLQDQLLSEGYGKPIIDASHFAEPDFLEQYAFQNPSVHLLQVSEANEVFRTVPDATFAQILEYFRKRGIRARMVAFAPSDVPAVMVYPPNAEFIKRTKNAIDEGVLPNPFSELIGEYISRMKSSDDLTGTLQINASNPLIEKLSTTREQGILEAGLGLVYELARLFNGRLLSVDDVKEAFQSATSALVNLLPKGDEDAN